MSYSTVPAPAALKLEVKNNQLVLSFICPRCDKKQAQVIDPTDLLYDVSVQCKHPKCTGPGERPGFTLSMIPLWEGLELGLSDRPLHQP